MPAHRPQWLRAYALLHEVRTFLSQLADDDPRARSLIAEIERQLHATADAPLLVRGRDGRLGPRSPRLCECGCGKPTRVYDRSCASTGARRGYPRRFLQSHHARLQRRGYTVDPRTGCWNYNGKPRQGGYPGHVWNGKRYVPGHRYYYEQAKGPIPPGLFLDHLCRNRLCVNPDHLEPVTPAENVRRGLIPKLSVAKAREIRSLETSASTTALAKRYGVSETTIRDVRTGRQWRERHDAN